MSRKPRILAFLPALVAITALSGNAFAQIVPTITEFNAEPSAVAAGEKATLRWSVSGATTLRIDPEVGVVSGTTQEVTPPIAQWFPIVERGSVWRYQDERVDLYSPAIPFYHPDFNDSGWASGRARLGYGGDGEVTTINGGTSGSRRIASYYRQVFEIEDRRDVSGAAIEVARDDGVVIYINGIEVLRDNMPTGAIGFTTQALEAAGGADETTFFRFQIDTTMLKTGRNVVAVGLHQAAPTSSDLGLDLELSLHRSGTAHYRLTAGNANGSVSSNIRVPVDGVRFALGKYTEADGFLGPPLAGDMDGDGDADFVGADADWERIIWVENVEGVLVPRETVIPRTANLYIYALQDLTGDGVVDLIFRDEDRLGYFVNDGMGGISETVILKYTLREYGTVLTGDPDEDGDDDIIVMDRDDGVIGYYPNHGPSNLGEFRVIANMRSALPVNGLEMIEGDFNGDHHMDFMIRAEVGYFYWLRNTGVGTYVFSRVDNGQEPDPLAMRAADLDADGRDELLVSSVQVRNNRVNLFNLENGQWIHSVPFAAFYRVHAGDYNGDGGDELFRKESTGNLTLFESGADGEALDAGYTALLGGQPAQLNRDPSYGDYGTPYDLDGDGDLDLVASGQQGSRSGVIFAENLTLNDPLIVSFASDKSRVTPGDSATLSWEVKFADRLEIVGIGAVTGSSLAVSPIQTTNYELVAYRDGNAMSAFVTVTVIADADGDGLDDSWEIQHFGNLTSQSGTGDPDEDGATNLQEQASITDPNKRDTDGDGLDDGVEIVGHFSDPLKGDTDDDGVGDALEFAAGTNPRSGASVPSPLLDGLVVYGGLDSDDLRAGQLIGIRNLAGMDGFAIGLPLVVGDGVVGEGLRPIVQEGVRFEHGIAPVSSRSLSVWLRLNQSRDGVVMRMPGGGGVSVTFQGGDQLRVIPTDSAPILLPGLLPFGWNHLFIAYDAASNRYVAALNGVSVEVPGAPPGPGSSLFQLSPNGDGMEFDEIAIWNRALTADERVIVLQGGQGGVPVPVLAGPALLPTAEVIAPVGTTAYIGQRFQLQANVVSLTPATIQWLRDGVEIPEANGTELRIEVATPGDAGGYAVRVTNLTGTVTSSQLAILARDPVPVLSKRLAPIGLLPSLYPPTGSDLDGDLAAIGNARPSDNSGGMVHLFERDEGGAENWSQVATLRSDAPTTFDRFGQSLVIDDGLVLVAAPGTHFSHPGEVFVFERVGGNWARTQKITGGDFVEEFAFGRAMALHGGLLAVSAWKDEREGIGVVYLFERQVDGSWAKVRSFDCPDLLVFDNFGQTLDLHEDVLVVGAPGDSEDFRGAGVVYVFERHAGGPNYWGNVLKTASSPNRVDGAFGSAVSVYEGAFAVGSYDESSSSDRHGDYYFRPDGTGGWAQVQRTLVDYAGNARERFPMSFALHGSFSLTLVQDAGRFYLRKSGTTSWEDLAETTVPLSEDFGSAIHMSGSTILVEPWFIYEQPAVAPIIHQQPRAFDGTSGTLRVRAGGSGDLSYRWLRDGTEISDATGDELVVDANDEGSYSVRVSNFFRSVESRPVRVEVPRVPTITEPPSRPVRDASGTLYYLVGASGVGNQYQWFRNNEAIPGATHARLDVTDPKLADVGIYTVRVTNAQGSVTSAPLDVRYGDLLPLQIARLTNADGAGFIRLGQAVELHGSRAMVGAPYADNSRGAVYVFEDSGVLAGGGWSQVARLVSSDRADNDRFGSSLDFEGDLAVVGASEKHAPSLSRKGAAYLFRRQPNGSWVEFQRLEGPDEFGRFGHQVKIENGRVFVSAYGRVWVYAANGSGPSTRWEVIGELPAPNGSVLFGWSMDVSGDWLAIGDSQNNARGERAGTVYLYQEFPSGSGAWLGRKALFASNAGGGKFFGNTVAIDRDLLVAGESRGNDAPGSVFVFERNAGGTNNWGETKRIIPGDGQSGDNFGSAIAIDEGALLVGASNEDDGSQGAGSAYFYRRPAGGGSNWMETKFGADDPGETHVFGFDVALSRGQALIGGNGANAIGNAYVFMMDGPPVADESRVEGVVRAGVTVRSDFMFSDGESDPEGMHRYQWFRADDAAGSNTMEIPSATAEEYRPVAEDIGRFLSVRVTPVAASGYESGVPHRSPFSGPVERARTSLSISVDEPDPSVFGAAVVVNFSIMTETEEPLQTLPGGTVTLSSEGSDPVVVNLPAGGGSIRLTRTGRVDIVASYSGDEVFEGSSASAAHLVIPEVRLTAFEPDTVVEDSRDPVLAMLSRTGDMDESLSVAVSFGGSATMGDDYAADAVLVIPAGARQVALEVTLVADNLDEPDEEVEVVILPHAAYAIVGDHALLTIRDDDFSPVPLADEYGVVEDGLLVIPAAGGVLGNDTDEDDGGGPGTLIASLVQGVSHGQLALADDGSFTYVPAPDYFGEDSFSYTASDGTNVSESVVVSIEVAELVDVTVTAAESRDPVVAGHGGLGTVEHVLTVRNNGPSHATGVSVDVSSLVPTGATVSGGALVNGRWLIGGLAENGIVSMTLLYAAGAVVPGGTDTIRTSATLSAVDQPVAAPLDDGAMIATSVVSPASIGLEELDVAPVLNLQTGYFQQRIRVTNHNSLEVLGLRLRVGGLPAGTIVRNGTGGVVTYANSLAPGESVVLTIEFESSDRNPNLDPVYVVELLGPDEGVLLLEEGTRFEIDRMQVLAGGSILIECPSEAGKFYSVEYSSDMRSWRPAGVPVKAGGNRLQWIDNGAPKTSSHPSVGGLRYYRMVRLASRDAD